MRNAAFSPPLRTLRAKIRDVLRLVAVNTFVLLLGLIVLEFFFGTWGGNSIKNLNLVVDRRIVYQLENTYAWRKPTVTYTRDKLGFRGQYSSPNTIGILTIGGSATDQRFIEDGYTWQDVMALEFKNAGRPLSVVNAGVDGQTTVGHTKDFDWWFSNIPDLKTRFVLAYVGVNDMFLTDGSPYDNVQDRAVHKFVLPAEERDQLDDKELGVAVITSAWDFAKDRSALYRLYRTWSGMKKAREVHLSGRRVKWVSVRETTTPALHDYEVHMQPLLTAYAGRLRVLLAKIRSIGATPILVTQSHWYAYKEGRGTVRGSAAGWPFFGQTANGVDLYYMHRVLDRVTLEECAKSPGCVGIDLNGELLLSDDDFYDYVHNTPSGAAKIGTYLAAKLLASGIISVVQPGTTQ